MLLEKAFVEAVFVPPITTPSPITAGVIYDGTQIFVPVHYTDADKVFAPPFLIPKGVWTVIYQVQTSGFTFQEIDYHGRDCAPDATSCETPAGLRIEPNVISDDRKTCTTVFDTNHVTQVNMLGCTISLLPPSAARFVPGKRRLDRPVTGDPTITVVQDPIDG